MTHKKPTPRSSDALNERWSQSLVAAQRGDGAVYRVFLTELSRKVQKIVLKKISNSALAEDVVQEVLLAVHRALPTYRPDQSATGWIYAITRNKVFDALRSYYRREHKTDFYDEEFDLHDYSQLIFEEEDRAQKATVLQELLAGLSDEQREVLRLTKIEGHSVEEVSKQLGISRANVKVITHRAMRRLQELAESGVVYG